MLFSKKDISQSLFSLRFEECLICDLHQCTGLQGHLSNHILAKHKQGIFELTISRDSYGERTHLSGLCFEVLCYIQLFECFEELTCCTGFLHYNKKFNGHTFTTIVIASICDLDEGINILEPVEHRSVNG